MNLDSRAEELLHAIRESPEDDGPRLVFADHIAERWPAHAAWIVAELTGKTTPELEQAFLDELPPVLRTRETVFWRGFVDTDEWKLTESDFFALDPDELFRLAPTCTRIQIENPTAFEELAARIRRFDGLDLYHAKLGAASAKILAGATGLAHLRTLKLSEANINNKTIEVIFRDACFHDLERFGLGIFASKLPSWSTICGIADAPFAHSLRAFELAGPYLDIVEIVDLLPALVELRSSGNTIDTRIARVQRRLQGLAFGLSRTGDDVADALAASSVLAEATMFAPIYSRWSDEGTNRWLRARSYGPLRELRLGYYESPAVARALVESELPQSLERLTLLATGWSGEDVSAFASCAWPRLRELALDSIEEVNVATLARAPWLGNLERLSLRDNIDEPAARALAEVLGPRTRLAIEGGMDRSVYALLRNRFGRRLTGEG